MNSLQNGRRKSAQEQTQFASAGTPYLVVIRGLVLRPSPLYRSSQVLSFGSRHACVRVCQVCVSGAMRIKSSASLAPSPVEPAM